MKIYEITFSPTGGTRRVSEILTAESAAEIENISLLSNDMDYSTFTFTEEDVCLIAVPSFGGRVPAAAVERIRKMKGNHARAVLLCVYGNRAYEDTLLELKDTVKEAGFLPVAAVAAVAEHSIMRQFAAGRPDEADKNILMDFAKYIWGKIESGEALPEVKVPGNKDYREYGGVPFRPDTDKKCNGCKICVKECPVGAIDAENPGKIHKEKCISCMRCIAVCPQHAKHLNKLMLAGAAMKMAKVFEEKKKNELFVE
ncbi:MAG: 4Fe-4S binding protein [Lachnospiraceae bacterium]|nr:4Fe-4S binding protein [Lachnospiraceae bacterium]